MTYVYDLILNFEDILYEFYEWEKSDDIIHIKRINLFKIPSKNYNDLLMNKVKFSKSFLSTILNRCEYFKDMKVKNFPYCFLVTDTYRVMGIMLNSDGILIKYSSLLLDEEEEVLEISERISLFKIEYTKINKVDNNSLTRYENKIISYIKNEIDSCYNIDNEKLKYLYYEYFGKENTNINNIYDEFDKILKKDFNNNLVNLYELIKLSYSKM